MIRIGYRIRDIRTGASTRMFGSSLLWYIYLRDNDVLLLRLSTNTVGSLRQANFKGFWRD